MSRLTRAKKARGLAVVETSLVLPLVLMVLFGIIEGCRLITSQELLDNAAREGARLARVGARTLTTADIQGAVVSRFSGNSTSPGLTVMVYRADEVTGQNVGPWTDAARGDAIAVEATYTHATVLPTFGLLPSTTKLHSKSVLHCEVN